MRLRRRADRPGVFASSGLDHGGNPGPGLGPVRRRIFWLLAALAPGPPGGFRPGPALAEPLSRPSPRASVGSASREVPAGDAHRVPRRKLQDPAGLGILILFGSARFVLQGAGSADAMTRRQRLVAPICLGLWLAL